MDSNTPIVDTPQSSPVTTTAIAAITVVAMVLLVSGCGQKGDLYLPTDPAARNRATLPQVLSPVRTTDSVPQGASTATAAPAGLPTSAASAAR